MLDLNKLIKKAADSAFYRWLLNRLLERMVPFNKPHRFRVTELNDESLRIEIPYRKRNFNHIRGLHACAMATLSEFTTGLLLLTRLDARKYRIIMQRLEMDYHYQGKMNAFATFAVTDSWLEKEIYAPLQNQDAVVIICEVKIHDIQGNHLSTGHVHWQIKDWQKVKTRISA